MGSQQIYLAIPRIRAIIDIDANFYLARLLLFAIHIYIFHLKNGINNTKSVSYTHLDVYKRQVFVLVLFTHTYEYKNKS